MGLPWPVEPLPLVLPAEWYFGCELGPRRQVGGGGEPAHVETDLGDHDGGRGRSDPGDLIEPGDRVTKRAQLLPDLGVDGDDVGVDGVNAGPHPGQQGTGGDHEGAQPKPSERFLQLTILVRIRERARSPGRWVAFPAPIRAAADRPARTRPRRCRRPQPTA